MGPGQSGRESPSLHPTCPLPSGVGTPLAPILPGGGSPSSGTECFPRLCPSSHEARQARLSRAHCHLLGKQISGWEKELGGGEPVCAAGESLSPLRWPLDGSHVAPMAGKPRSWSGPGPGS